MRTLRTSEAAAMLKVSPHTVRSWERRYGFPQPRRSSGGHRLYLHAEVAALRDRLDQGLSISSAISAASESGHADPQALVAALTAFRADRADEAMEASLAVRSLEHAVEEILLPGLDVIRLCRGSQSAGWAFAAGWAVEWLARARRLSSAQEPASALLVGDAADPFAPAAPLLRAFELCCVRAGLRVLTLPVRAPVGVPEAVAAVEPAAVVIGGGCASNEEVARWAYFVRHAAGPLPFLVYQRTVRGADAGTRVLPLSPPAAQRRLQERLCGT